MSADGSVKADRVISPPARQRGAGFVLFGAAVWIAALLVSSPGFVVVIGLVAITLIVSAGMALAIPNLKIVEEALVIRTSWGRKQEVKLAHVAGAELAVTKPPWRIILTTGWPFPRSFPTVTCRLTLSGGQVVPVDAMQSVRIPMVGYLITQTPEEAQERCLSLLELVRST